MFTSTFRPLAESWLLIVNVGSEVKWVGRPGYNRAVVNPADPGIAPNLHKARESRDTIKL